MKQKIMEGSGAKSKSEKMLLNAQCSTTASKNLPGAALGAKQVQLPENCQCRSVEQESQPPRRGIPSILPKYRRYSVCDTLFA